MGKRIQSTREKTLAAFPVERRRSPQTQTDVDGCTTLLMVATYLFVIQFISLRPAREWRQTGKKWLYLPFLQAQSHTFRFPRRGLLPTLPPKSSDMSLGDFKWCRIRPASLKVHPGSRMQRFRSITLTSLEHLRTRGQLKKCWLYC